MCVAIGTRCSSSSPRSGERSSSPIRSVSAYPCMQGQAVMFVAANASRLQAVAWALDEAVVLDEAAFAGVQR